CREASGPARARPAKIFQAGLSPLICSEAVIAVVRRQSFSVAPPFHSMFFAARAAHGSSGELQFDAAHLALATRAAMRHQYLAGGLFFLCSLQLCKLAREPRIFFLHSKRALFACFHFRVL